MNRDPLPDNSASIISGMTVQMIIRLLLIFGFCAFWVGPVVLPWVIDVVLAFRS